MTLDCACPRRIPDWDRQDIDLGGQCALTLPIPTPFHMPLAYENYVRRQHEDAERLQLKELWPGLVLTRTGLWRGEILRLVENTGSPSHRIKFFPTPYFIHARLHKGDIGTIRNTVREIQAGLLDSGHMPKELYLSYLTCPHCRETRGGDQILVLRHWQESGTLKKRIAK